METTAAQLRAARAILDMSQGDVALAARVGISTVRKAEAGGSVIPATLAAIQRALESAGIEFIEGGVKLKEIAQ